MTIFVILGDKTVIFSRSILTLKYLEHFIPNFLKFKFQNSSKLKNKKVNFQNSVARIDGSTPVYM